MEQKERRIEKQRQREQKYMELGFYSAFKAYLHVLRCEEKHRSNGTDQDSHPVWPSEEYIEGNTDTNNLWEIRDNDGELSNNPGD